MKKFRVNFGEYLISIFGIIAGVLLAIFPQESVNISIRWIGTNGCWRFLMFREKCFRRSITAVKFMGTQPSKERVSRLPELPETSKRRCLGSAASR